MSNNSLITELALHFKCPYCMALPGMWCKTKNGQGSYWMHSEREKPLRIAWSAGYREGKREVNHEGDPAGDRAGREAEVQPSAH